jgi:xanthine dehydrogenase accessory factor
VLRYGQGSPFIDIRLPCGSGVELLVEPAPDRAALGKVCAALARREPAELRLSDGEGLDFTRSYLPRLRLLALGSGPELAALVALARAQRIELTVGAPSDEAADATLALGRAPDCPVDRWTAIALLFHDHEWEQALVPWALATDAFYVGAQGGRAARESRLADLAARGFGETELSRLRSPIGLFPAARTPSALALSVLAEIVAEYEALLG